MESTRVESDGEGVFLHCVANFKCLGDIVPDFDGSVLRTSHNQLLSNTNIQTSDFLSMEWTVDIVEFWLYFSTVVKRDINF
jgi:hypothetical protein